MTKRILIIEDNNELRENLSEILQLSGYETIVAENGKIGVELAIKTNPDLILCDVMMPLLDGFGVLKILSGNPLLMDTPFMFLTAKSEKIDFRKGMNLGADDYITKPFDDVELLESIEIRLKKRERFEHKNESNTEIKHFFDESKGHKDLLRLTEDREIRKYKKGDSIYEEAHPANWLYFIKSGRVKCFKINNLGKELITHIYGAGDFFGFLPILSNSHYDDNTICIEDAEVCLIPPEEFNLLLHNNKNFAANFIKILALHADYNENQLLDLAYSSVRKKLANALLLLHQKSEKGKINIMRDDLASLCGTAKETVIRTLSDFKNEGIINIDKNNIKILHIDTLKSMPQ